MKYLLIYFLVTFNGNVTQGSLPLPNYPTCLAAKYEIMHEVELMQDKVLTAPILVCINTKPTSTELQAILHEIHE